MLKYDKLLNDFVEFRMGGYNSGRIGRKRKIEHYKALDVRYLQRERLLAPRSFSQLSWSRDGEQIGSIAIRAEAGKIRLIYTYTGQNGECENLDYPVSLTQTAC